MSGTLTDPNAVQDQGAPPQGLVAGLMSPQVQTLLGLAGGLAQAAMPSRMKIPLGAAIGMGAEGANQGLANYFNLQKQSMDNRRMAGLLSLAGGAPFGVPTSNTGAPAGALPPAVGQPGSGNFPGGGAPSQGGGSQSAPYGAPATTAANELALASRYAAFGLGDVATEHLKLAEQLGGGIGYTPNTNGGTDYTPHGPADPTTIARNKAAEANAGLPSTLAAQGKMLNPDGSISPLPGAIDTTQRLAGAQSYGDSQGKAPFQPPIKYTWTGADGVPRDYTVPVTDYARGAGAGQGSGGGGASPASSSAIPATAFASRVSQVESAGQGGQNPNSSAAGPSQFTDGTWQGFMQSAHPELLAGKTPQQIAAMKSDPNLSQEATLWLAQRNAGQLQQAGIQPNAANLGLAHHVGAQGAADVIRAAPDTPLSAIPSLRPALGVNPANGAPINPDLANATAGQLRSKYLMLFGNRPVGLPTASSNASGYSQQPPFGGVAGAPSFTPQQEAVDKAYGERSAQIMTDAAQARATMPKLQILGNAAAAFTPGASANVRLGAARAISELITQFGGTPPAFLQNGITGAETIDKEGVSLATQTAKGMGREPGFIISMIAKNLPNKLLSQGGYTAILNGLSQEAQRKQDLATFQDQWRQGNPDLGLPAHTSIAGMEAAFDKQFPPEAYASRVAPFPPPKPGQALMPNVIYRNAQGQRAMWDGQTFQPVGQ